MARIVQAFTLAPSTAVTVESVSKNQEFTVQLDTFLSASLGEEQQRKQTIIVDKWNLTEENKGEIARILQWAQPITDPYEMINSVGGEGTASGKRRAKDAADYLRTAFKRNRTALSAQEYRDEQRKKNNSTYGNISRTLEALVLLGVRSLKNADVSGSQKSNAGKTAHKSVNSRARKTVAA